MAFGPLPHALPILTVEGDQVAFVETATYTGTTFSSTARDIFVHHYTAKAKSARNIANASLSLESYVGSLPASIATALYNARVEPHLTMSCEVALDVRPSSLEHLERVQTAYLRRLLGLGPRSQLLPLYTETGIWPIRYRRAALVLRYLVYLLHTRPPLPFAALQESWEIAQLGHTSWWTDLIHVLANLPVPVQMDSHTFPTLTSVANSRRALESSLALYLRDGILESERLPILAHRFRRMTSPPRLAEACRPRSYLKVPSAAHREALTRLLTSEHPFAIETLRRTTPPVPRPRRICRFCRTKRWAVEDELHVLLECEHERLSQRRESFYLSVAPLFRGDLGRMRHRLSSQAFLDALLNKDTCLSGLAHYVYDLFEIFLSVPPLLLSDDTALVALAE
ncbi:hypothetical protein C8Q80DRAFT_1249994 [Daedaleopsis nitida]|nr:hypothetical protein C8Q80DRAFT_1249994 [Daedaleopsis nitida]